mmetsp:Transcript_15382/g.61892  ORF Transcript_15382/g.61892 Transcript_15382/m.61892 type:complete len:261 (-) Transcript_15382:689-1471(-)
MGRLVEQEEHPRGEEEEKARDGVQRKGTAPWIRRNKEEEEGPCSRDGESNATSPVDRHTHEGGTPSKKSSTGNEHTDDDAPASCLLAARRRAVVVVVVRAEEREDRGGGADEEVVGEARDVRDAYGEPERAETGREEDATAELGVFGDRLERAARLLTEVTLESRPGADVVVVVSGGSPPRVPRCAAFLRGQCRRFVGKDAGRDVVVLDDRARRGGLDEQRRDVARRRVAQELGRRRTSRQDSVRRQRLRRRRQRRRRQE